MGQLNISSSMISNSVLGNALKNVKTSNGISLNASSSSSSSSSSSTDASGYNTTTGTPTTYTVVVNSDNIEGKSADKARIDICVNALKQAGYNAISSGVGPNWHVTDMRTHKNSYIVCIVGGLCAGTIADYGAKYYQNYMSANNNKGGQALYGKHSKYKVPLDQIPFLERAWDDNFSPGSFKGIDNPAQYMNEHNFNYCIGGVDGNNEEFAQAVVNMVKTGGIGSGGSGSGSGTVTVTEGTLFSHEGQTPQFWNMENYYFPIEIRFTNFSIEEKNPRIRTASFESVENIDLTEGRVAVLITGDCNDFGGIIIKKEFDSTNKIYKYQCQGFMERIMASPVYVVANGGKTAHRLIEEYLAAVGLPSVELGEEDEYDVFIEEELRNKMKADEDLAESADIFNAEEETTTSTSSSSGTSSDSETKTIKTVTKTESSNEDGSIINTFKSKPVGIYDKKTGEEWIRTMIYDYGINVDFYGDVNGIPHFDVMNMDLWRRTGWYLSPNMGFESDYDYTFDITNIVTQVGVKNIQAINGNGELYTSEELLGVNVEDFVGRMGTIVDNPSERQAVSESDGEQVEQIKSKYQDNEGNEYSQEEVIETKGEPSCKFCAKKNGGLQPEQKIYEKAWLDKCPGCETKNKLKSKKDDSNPHGVTVCGSCGLEFCQYCGFETSNGNYQLVELIKQTPMAETETSSLNSSSSVTVSTDATNNSSS